MRKFIILLFLGTVFCVNAQQFTFKKGVVTDSIAVKDSISESFSLFLPTAFELDKNWPILFIFDMEGKGRQALRMYREAAEDQGFILAASNNVSDSLSTSQNIMITGRMLNTVIKLLPIHKNRTYTAGFGEGGQFASVLPLFVRGITGVISTGAAYPNLEVLDANHASYFIGIIGKEDFAYPDLLVTMSAFDKLKIPNDLLVFDGGHEWPENKYLKNAMEILTLSAMAKGHLETDDLYVDKTYNQNLAELTRLMNSNKSLEAFEFLEGMQSIFRLHKDVDTLKIIKRQLKRDKVFKIMKRNESNAMLKEAFIKEDYIYYLEEDIATYNYKNLGWWTYQMEELKKYEKSKILAERQMGKRLLGFINALIEDNIDVLEAEKEIDYDALSLVWMLKTITQPKEYDYYLKIIAKSAEVEDFGTSLFYLEELLKNGYTDKAKLYQLENTALLRITPEFNQIVEKYLKEARYEPIED
ncbi:hypothetical protein KCTC52924_02397 [Arenibacter antarcticus]|uniref:Alpha/beta hydrolase n=1 Tax=Arenibacter antarcticus TaxID=2040469 RepID=A0ABW5VJL4_9FLAO|nr:alpha/beta hydrolase [Arenibacter sp. H213]MCM4168705.1 alpha/beta hydrolase [Arenibacter sp. H213]